MTTFLDPLDATFLLGEVAGTAMHIGAIIELDGGAFPDPETRFRVIRENVAARLHEIPALLSRVVTAPLHLSWPVLVPEHSIDVDRHIIRVALPAPGTPDQFDEVIASFLSRPFPRYRPLWQMLVVEGFADGHCAVVFKVHHALADGVSGVETFAGLLDLSPEVRQPGPAPELSDDGVRSGLGLLWRSVRAMVRQPSVLGRVVVGWFRRIYEVLAATTTFLVRRGRDRHATSHQPTVFDARRYALSGAPGVEKDYHRLQLSLAEVKRAAKSRGATVTDFVTCVVSGALRRYLEEDGASPQRDLIAFVPIDVRGQGDRAALGNQISGMLSRLHVEIEDADERLRAIHDDNGATVAGQREHRAELFQDIPRILGPLAVAGGVRLLKALGAFDAPLPTANLFLSSVAGPPLELWMSGLKVRSVAPVGPLLGPFSLNITALGLKDYVEFGIFGCARRVSRMGHLRDLIAEEAQNLIANTPTA